MPLSKTHALILLLLIQRQGGQYDTDLVKISHGALSRLAIRSQLMSLASQNLVRREDAISAYVGRNPGLAKWFITDAGRSAAATHQSLSADAIVLLQHVSRRGLD